MCTVVVCEPESSQTKQLKTNSLPVSRQRDGLSRHWMPVSATDLQMWPLRNSSLCSCFNANNCPINYIYVYKKTYHFFFTFTFFLPLHPLRTISKNGGFCFLNLFSLTGAGVVHSGEQMREFGPLGRSNVLAHVDDAVHGEVRVGLHQATTQEDNYYSNFQLKPKC